MSEIRQGVRDYLALRRSLGFTLLHHENLLNDFVSFFEERELSHITTREAMKWARRPQGAQPPCWARRLGMVRGFARFWIASDPRTEIPPLGLLPSHYERKAPYIYTDGQICQLIEAAKLLPSKTGLRRWTYSTILGLIAVGGLRVSEAINLDNQDADLEKGILVIRKTKYGKTRLIPVHRSTQRELRKYVQHRDRVYPKSKTPAFFVAERGTRLTDLAVRATFNKLSRQIGLRGQTDSHGPRLHDLRHTMAVRTIIDWYRAGLNIDEQMPKLSTYLGHTGVANTYWYLSAVPELLCLARDRLEDSKGGLS
jgi:site-specific recombinase XerD